VQQLLKRNHAEFATLHHGMLFHNHLPHVSMLLTEAHF
jgi:hypothetical protein